MSPQNQMTQEQVETMLRGMEIVAANIRARIAATDNLAGAVAPLVRAASEWFQLDSTKLEGAIGEYATAHIEALKLELANLDINIENIKTALANSIRAAGSRIILPQ